MTLRRLYGGSLLDIIEGRIQPQLCPSQAATRGCGCGPNVAAAYRHLEAGLITPPRQPVGPLWFEILGPLAQPALELAARLEVLAINDVPAVFLGDQSKAFERVVLAWVLTILRRWGLPPWLLAAFGALIQGRGVQYMAGGK